MTDKAKEEIQKMAVRVNKYCSGTLGGETCFSCRLGMYGLCTPFKYAKLFYDAGCRMINEKEQEVYCETNE